MIDVVTVWAPRRDHPKWRDDYAELLRLQAQSVQRAGHRHVVVTDTAIIGEQLPADGALELSEWFHVNLPRPLIRAIVAGQLAWLRHWSGEAPTVLLDVDCLVLRALDQAFDGSFDIGVTAREHPTQPVQNGALYFAPGSQAAAVALFEQTLARTGEQWGSDQEALAKALAPVPQVTGGGGGVKKRLGVRVAFLKTDLHNRADKRHALEPSACGDAFVAHFKGESKQWAPAFAAALLAAPPAA